MSYQPRHRAPTSPQVRRRRYGAASLLVASIVGVAAFTGASSGLPHDELLEHVHDMLHGAGFADPTTTTTLPPTTTTLAPTTTTRVRPTTTTIAPTTTAAPTTTTTTFPPQSGDSFTIMLGDFNTGARWWEALYRRDLTTGAGWTDGDRSGYRCAYMFLEAADGTIVGRVTFTLIPEAQSYGAVNDRFMVEGARYYDGTVAPPGSPRELGDCPAPTETYEPYAGPDERPTIDFVSGGTVLERRDYKTTVAGAGVIFNQVLVTPQRITVIGNVDGLPVVAVYYDSLVEQVSITSDIAA